MIDLVMEAQAPQTGIQLFGLFRSAAAIILGAIVVVALSIGSDQLMHATGVFPPPGQPIKDHGLLLIAFCYRSIYGIMGSYVTARFSPHSPMLHVWIGAGIGFVASLTGVIAAVTMNLRPYWYPVALFVTALPCAWLGGRIHQARSRCSAARNRV